MRSEFLLAGDLAVQHREVETCSQRVKVRCGHLRKWYTQLPFLIAADFGGDQPARRQAVDSQSDNAVDCQPVRQAVLWDRVEYHCFALFLVRSVCESVPREQREAYLMSCGIIAAASG